MIGIYNTPETVKSKIRAPEKCPVAARYTLRREGLLRKSS